MRTPWPELRQPPVLDVAFDELPRRRPQQVLAGQRRARGGERHAVLQLVAEAVGAARLVEGGAGPDAAGERLVEQPAVQHDVHRPVGRLHLDRPEDVVPVLGRPRTARRRGRRRGSCAISVSRALRRSRPRRGRRRARRSRSAAARPSSAARRRDRARRRRRRTAASHRASAARRGERSVAADELAPVARPVRLAPAEVGEGDARPEGRVPRLRANIAPVAGSISVVTKGADDARDGPSTHSA